MGHSCVFIIFEGRVASGKCLLFTAEIRLPYIHTVYPYLIFLNIFSEHIFLLFGRGRRNTTELPSVPRLIHSLAVITVRKLKQKVAKEQEHLTSCCSSKVCNVSVAVE